MRTQYVARNVLKKEEILSELEDARLDSEAEQSAWKLESVMLYSAPAYSA